MFTNKFAGMTCGVLLAVTAVLLVSGCSINVKKEKNGNDKQVEISTPVGGIHVSKDAEASDTGLPVYPGARAKEKTDGQGDTNANVNISSFGFGLKVVVLKYETDDAPDKVVAYYKDQLKKYGDVLVCRTSNFDIDTDLKNGDENSHELTCKGGSGVNVELKVGNKENQHIVAVQPEGKGSEFSLVYLRTHGKEAEI